MKLDINEILSRLDQNDFRLYDDIVERGGKSELDKNISWLIPQWMTGAHTDSHQENLVMMFDEACNPGWSYFYKHPELQAKLLAVMGLGRVKHKFHRPTAKRKSSTPDLLEMLQNYYEDIRDTDVALWCRDTNIDDLEEIMDCMGMQVKERGIIRKQYQQVKQCQ